MRPDGEEHLRTTAGTGPAPLRRIGVPRSRRALVVGAVLVVASEAVLLGGPRPGDHPPSRVCWDGLALHADVDADGREDRVVDGGADGRAAVLFTEGDSDRDTPVTVDEARGFWQKLRGALRKGMATRGAFGDFDGDGYLDLALFYSQRDAGDSTNSVMPAHEVRYGPLARDLSGSRTRPVRMPYDSFVEGVRTADGDHDGRAELHVFQSRGDGARSEYVGRQRDGGVSVSRQEVAAWGSGEWRSLPWTGLADFGMCAG
ncbi:hypothetical protein ABT026_21445 [Streptomyces sp. NPDC002734]|uniref:hypothetical protein n=1 Tax=Streptomyces sp. NPDC002734 TaxID=3154426 RepID=UPI00332C2E0C